MKSPSRVVLVVGCALFAGSCARCGDSPGGHAPAALTVAAAADLSSAFQEMGAAFQKKTGNPVTITYGASGMLARQIGQGASYDVFASANLGFIDEVVKGGACLADSKTLYARGHIAMWTRRDSKDSPETLADLARPSFVKIAIANPDHAPYGRAAKQALTTAGLWRSVSPRLVYGENVQQALQFAQTGNADVAIVGLSLASAAKDGRVVPVDSSTHEPLDQALVVCNNRPGKDPGMVAAGRQFAAFVVSEEGQAIMKRYGFTSPAPASTGADAAAAKPFGAFCTSDAECAGGVCFHKRLAERAEGRESRDAGQEALEDTGFCSMRCTEDRDCPTPPTSGHCGARGMCKSAARDQAVRF
jgi:molybdate transport system substrate-binding protein